MSVIVAPSVLSANFLHLQQDIEMLNQSVAQWIHVDVMDGVFVDNISFGFPVLQAIKKVSKKIVDVHLMIQNPAKYIPSFIEAGAQILSIHYEACPHLHANLQAIKKMNCKASIAINPHTPVQLLFDVLEEADNVCIMSVNPGFGGQQFIPHTLQKIEILKEFIVKNNMPCAIEVDGGVTLRNYKQIRNAGADILVVGNTVFSSENPMETIQQLMLD